MSQFAVERSLSFQQLQPNAVPSMGLSRNDAVAAAGSGDAPSPNVGATPSSRESTGAPFGSPPDSGDEASPTPSATRASQLPAPRLPYSTASLRLKTPTLVALVLSILLLSLGPVAAQPIGRPAPFAGARLPRPMRGADALRTMTDRLADVAAFHRMKEPELRELLQRDRALWLDREGRLFFVCEFELPQEGPVGESTNTLPVAPLYALNQTFRLHSRAGANRVIYLDFDGHDASTTSWGANGAAPIARPYDTDGNSATFSTTERQAIQYIWARVAEDYQQYNIDVTTEDPGVAALKNNGNGSYGVRVVIGGSSGDWYGSAGGVAYLRSFDDNADQPCWVFPGSLGNSEKNIAEASSHEAGHTLGLSHDGKTDGTAYYSGQGNWAPIMGVAYSKSVGQWSIGEYNLANNTEDDLTKMLSYGASYRTDDHGDTVATATALVGVSPAIWGVISTRTDVDFFSFQAGAGTSIITAAPATRGGNLHILLSLFDGSGTLITSAETADNSSGVQPVTLTRTLAAGTYYLSVDGIGVGTPATTGYSDYASLGQYTVNLTLPSTGLWSAAAEGSYDWNTTANWSGGVTPNSADAIARLTNNIAGNQTVTIDQPIMIGSLLLGDADGADSFLLATSGGGLLNLNSVSARPRITKVGTATDEISATISLQTDSEVSVGDGSVLTISGPVSGNADWIKLGNGQLLLTGANTYAKRTVVMAGTLSLNTTSVPASSPALDVRAGATLDVVEVVGGFALGSGQTLLGAGVVTGAVTVASGGHLSPATNGTAGTLSLSNSLDLASGSSLDLDLAATTEVGGGTNDLIAVAGDLTLIGTVTVNFNFLNGLPQSPGTYTLITYGGTLTGGAANLTVANANNRFDYVFDDTTPGEIRVQVTGAPAALVWQGGVSANLWNTAGATNWLRSGSPDAFFNLDPVLFDDSGSVSPAVNLSGVLTPPSLTVSNSVNYTFSGSGRISGPATLTKQGVGALTLNTANDFSGPTLVSEGTLTLGNAAALGTTNGGTTISGTGQLNLNGLSIGDEPVTVSGDGLSGAGAIVNNGAAQQSAVRNATLAGNTTFGGSGRWDLRADLANNVPASLAGNNFALTKTGGNEIWLVDLGNTDLGAIAVNQGTLGLQGSTTLGNSAATLTVNPGATLAFWNTFDNNFNKVLSLNSCTLLDNLGHTMLIGAGTISGTVSVSASEAATLELRGALGGSGGFTKTGVGILRLAGANSFAGNITVSAGTLVAGNNAALGNVAGTTTIASGAVLDVAAYNLGAEVINVGGSGISSRGAIINSLPTGQQNALRFVTLTANTTFGGNGRWDIRANPTGSLLGAYNLTKTSDNQVWLVGLGATALLNITISEGTLGIQDTTTLGNPASTMTVNTDGVFSIWNTGTNILSKNLTLSTGRISNASGNNTFAGATTLSGSTNVIDVASGTTLTLTGVIGGTGYFGKTSTGTLILAANNTATGTSTNSAGTLQLGNGGPAGSLNCNLANNAALLFNRATDLTHSKIISGTGTLTKQAANVLTLSAANTFSGTTTVSAGTLRVGNNAALGTTAAGATIANGATLDLNGFPLGIEAISVVGAGVGGAGAIVNNGAAQLNALATVILTGNTTLGGMNRWDLTSGGAGLNSGGQAYALTKVGANTIGLNNVAVDAGLGAVNIQEGTLSLELGTAGLGNPAYSAIVSDGATLALYSLSTALTKPITLLSGATLAHNGPASGGANSTLSSSITLPSGDGTISNASPVYALSLNGAIGGAGNLVKQGVGVVQLGAANSYNGSTLINAGTLRLVGSGSIANSPGIAIGAGATLDIAALAGFTLGAGQVLSGNGTVLGNLTANGNVAPGASIGRLTVTGNTLLAGTTSMEISKQGGLTNDVLSVGGTLTYGGTLHVVLAGATPLAADDTFTLFTAANRLGAFSATNLPALAGNLAWDLSQLNSAGLIKVVSAVLSQPTVDSVSLSDGNLIMTGSGGTAGGSYAILTSTNAALPILDWWTNATGIFGAGGEFSNAIPVDVANPQRFYLLKQP